MEKMSDNQLKSVISESKTAQKSLERIIKLNNLHITEDFIELFREKYSDLFRTSMKVYMRQQEFLEETSIVINYIESLSNPNSNEKIDFNQISPEIQELFFRAINQAYLEVSRKNNF